ncbi:MAG: M48 family metallopeptidase [Candidatus Diapherotrites archaeon]
MIWEHVSSNKRDSILLFIFFFLIMVLFAYVFSILFGLGIIGFLLIGIIVAIITIAPYYYSDSIVLKISQARPATHEEHTFLDNTVEGLAIAAGIPKPKIYVIEDTAPNAFATGRDPEHAVICVTTGLMKKLNRVELEGVIAHEMSHIGNYDIRFMMYVSVMLGLIVLLSDLMRFSWRGNGSDNKAGALFIVIGLVLAIFAPICAKLIQLAISRKREFLADASAAMLTRYPEGLASALEKLEKDTEPLEAANKATAHLYIVNPLKDHKGTLNNLFSTHPPIAERVKRLRSM